MFSIDKDTQKCPNFMKAIVDLNKDLFPDSTSMGINVTVNTNARKFFGGFCAPNKGDLFLTNQLNMGTLNGHGSRYGFSYYNATRNPSADGFAMVQASLEGDTHGEVTGDLSCSVTKNLMFSAWGQRESNGGKAMVSLLEWSGKRYNTNAELSFDPSRVPGIVLTASHMFRINNRWSIGNYFMAKTADTSSYISFGSLCRGRWSLPDVQPIDFGGALRYDGDSETVTASVDTNANATLQYQRRVNDALTVGAEVCADVTQKTVKMTWQHRAMLDGGLEMRGRLDTNGMVIGHVRKAFWLNKLGSIVVGITTMLDHKNDTVGCGVEAEVNIGTNTTDYD